MDIHSHKCRKCGKVWTHDGDENQKLDKEGYDALHVCCGQIQRNRWVSSNPTMSKLMEMIHDLEDA
jgi:hypothetical protein